MLNTDNPAPRPALDVADVDSVIRAANAIDREARTVLAGASGGTETRDCYVTYATPEYALGLVVLLRSLRRQSARPVIVLTDRAWSFQTDEPNVFFVTVPRLGNARYAPSRSEIRATLTKLWIFGLLSFRRLVYLDADCLVVGSIEDLFDRTGVWCAPDYVEGAHSHYFNTGLIAFDPRIALRDRIFGGAEAAESYDHGDQGLLNTLIADEVQFLPPEYSVTRHYRFFHGPEMNAADVRVIHYIVKKPWSIAFSESPDTALIDLDDMWTEELTHAELKALVALWRRRQFTIERPRLESLRQVAFLTRIIGSAKVRYAVAAAAAGVFAILSICALALLIYAVAALVR